MSGCLPLSRTRDSGVSFPHGLSFQSWLATHALFGHSDFSKKKAPSTAQHGEIRKAHRQGLPDRQGRERFASFVEVVDRSSRNTKPCWGQGKA